MNNTELLNQLLSITIWKRIDGYDNYEISICGQVRNVRTKRVLKPRISKSGYYRVELYNSIKQSTQNIHRLVAKAFIPNLNNDDFVDHINNIKIDNTISNLRWCTNQQNQFNASLNKTNTSGVRGVYWCKEKNKWRATITYNHKKIHLGYYDNLEDAKIARQKKAAELFGEFINSCEL